MDSPIRRYLEDAIAAEKSFESQLRGFAEETASPEIRSLFQRHADETKEQYRDLTARLEALGGSASNMKSALAHVFNAAPAAAQTGHTGKERTTQDLMMAFSVENAEVAMYEALAIAAETAGDPQTADLARRIQAQESATAGKVWDQIAGAASAGFEAARAEERDGVQVIVRYLQDAEAAERNFEDALTSFGKSGDQPDVQSLMGMMSEKARTQHQRLEARLKELGASRSAAKSMLAHLLGFAPVSAQTGHHESEKSTQHLIITCAAAAAEMAMYEALAAAGEAAGDTKTVELARQLQREETEDYRLASRRLPESARTSSQLVLCNV